MALFGTGTNSKYWSVNGLGWSSKSFRPVTIAGWMKGINFDGTIRPSPVGLEAGLPGGAGVAEFGICWPAASEGGLYADIYDGSGFIAATPAGAPGVNAWGFGMAVLDSAVVPGRVTAYQGIKGTVTSAAATMTLTADQTWTDLCITQWDGCVTDTTDLCAEVAVWNRALGLAEARALALGTNPLALPGQPPLFYFPLRGDLRNLGSDGRGLRTLGGAVAKWGEHPPVNLPPRRRLFYRAAAALPPTARRPRVTMVL